MANNTHHQTPSNHSPKAKSWLTDDPGEDSATQLIRDKLDRIYASEPNALQELAEAAEAGHRSQHQQFMYELSNSGKDLATIQTAWHNYYQSLSNADKHQVWQEFYASQSAATRQPTGEQAAQILASHKHQAAKPKRLRDARTTDEVRSAIRHKVSAGGKLQAKHHLQSLLFGLGMGAIVLIIFLFGFFNEVVIAPFIQPSRTTASTPLIINADTAAVSDQPEVIIPKINVQIPVDYNQTSIDENQIEGALESGVVHYPTTAVPGQAGNAAFFGHSSNNIFNKGRYKFAFVLLHTLEKGDTFYLSYGGKMYAYKVISKQIVNPSDVGVLGPVPGQPATATLITCDPPGTSLHRLVVVGQQISPDPSGNSQAIASTSTTPTSLPGNGPTLWGRLISTAIGKLAVFGFMLAAALLVAHQLNRHLDRRLTPAS